MQKKLVTIFSALIFCLAAFIGSRVLPSGKMFSWTALAMATTSNSSSNSSSNASSNSSSNATSNSTSGSEDTVTICHDGGTLTVNLSALQAHQGHSSDTMGACVSCDEGQGNITLDASRSVVSGGGTVWSNTPLVSATDASRGTNVSLRGTATTIINKPGSDGVLRETQTEFTATSSVYTNLNAAGGLDPLTFFADPYNQLFDFGRYNAAAAATGNTLSWDDFVHEVENCSTLYGIVSVTVDGSGGDKSLDTGCVSVKGTLVFNVTGAPSPGGESSSNSSSNSSGNSSSNSSSNSSGNSSSNSSGNGH